jgi:hypothetical protein
VAWVLAMPIKIMRGGNKAAGLASQAVAAAVTLTLVLWTDVAPAKRYGDGEGLKSAVYHHLSALTILAMAAGTALNGCARRFQPWNRSISTEIYLCHTCSRHEIDIEGGNAAAWAGC